MKYIYKLIDKATYEILKDKSAISLSRPIMTAFKSEAKGFKLFRQMLDMNLENISIEELCSDKDLRINVLEWIKGYKESLSDELKKEYSCEYIKSDLEIAMSEYFRTYCGYFSYKNLEDKTTYKKFIMKYPGLSNGKDFCIKIPTESNHLDAYATSWKESGEEKYVYEFHKKIESEEDSYFEDAVLHIHGVKYVDSYRLKMPFKDFNQNDDRRISSLLKYLDEKYSDQAENRLMLWIPRREVYDSIPFYSDSFVEMMINVVRNLCLEAQKYPEFIYLKIEEFDVSKCEF